MRNGIICGIILGAAMLPCFAADNNIFAYNVGDIEVWTFVENQRDGGVPTNLIGADAAAIARYFADGTSKSQTNTFLIRCGGRFYLVDTGFGTTLFDNIKALGITPNLIYAVLLTHLHGDHTGGLQKDGKALFPNARVYLAQQEYDYWTRINVNQGAVDALAPYKDRLELIQPCDPYGSIEELFPGISPIAAFGHTPGHTGFLVESKGKSLAIVADMFHVEKIQFARPDIALTYDTDPVAAADLRKRALEYGAEVNIPIAGMHLVYPSIGRVSKDGSGYKFTPER